MAAILRQNWAANTCPEAAQNHEPAHWYGIQVCPSVLNGNVLATSKAYTIRLSLTRPSMVMSSQKLYNWLKKV